MLKLNQKEEVSSKFTLNLEEARIRAQKIRERVCEKCGITIGEMDSPARPERIAHPRMLAMYLVQRFTVLTLVEIGNLFGGRDHGTVIHARKRVMKAMADDPQVAEVVERLSPEHDPNQMTFKL